MFDDVNFCPREFRDLGSRARKAVARSGSAARLRGSRRTRPHKPSSPSRSIRVAAKASAPSGLVSYERQRSELPSRSDLRSPGPALEGTLLDIGAVPLLSTDEEVQLAARIKRGDAAAREQMIRANLRLVVKIARDYEHLGLPLADLVSEGIIGLMKAVDKFDPKKGGKLSTYGSWWIKQQIRRGLANQGRTIRLPVHVEAKLYQLGRAEVKLRNLLGREATEDELAEELSINTRRISRLRQASLRATSLEGSLGNDSESTVSEIVADERASTPFEQLQKKVDLDTLRGLLTRLTPREHKILSSRFGLDGSNEQTLEEVGRLFGLTRERIRQVQNEAFKKLRRMLEGQEQLAA